MARVGPRGRPVPQAPRSPAQHMEPWLESDESYERRRVVQSVFLLLKYVVDHVKFTVSLLAQAKGGEGSPATLCLCAALWRSQLEFTEHRTARLSAGDKTHTLPGEPPASRGRSRLT